MDVIFNGRMTTLRINMSDALSYIRQNTLRAQTAHQVEHRQVQQGEFIRFYSH
jgi:hypothetical protein